MGLTHHDFSLSLSLVKYPVGCAHVFAARPRFRSASPYVYTSGLYLGSDERLKRDIVPLTDCLPILMRLKAREYEYNVAENPGLGLAPGRRMGLIAQEVEEVLPVAVKEMAAPKSDANGIVEKGDSEALKAVNYIEMIPLLIGALQEQQKEIEALKEVLGR